MNVFFCLGLPRSGTSALARTFNLKDDIYCGFELFPFPEDIKRSVTTQYIEDLINHEEGSKQNLNQRVFLNKTDKPLRAIGNKQPLYYQLLREVSEANPKAQFVTIFRDIPFVIKSCNARARNAADGWPSGLIGALSGYMIADMCHCILTHACQATHHIFEYDSLLFGELRRQHLARLFESVGSELDNSTYEIFATKQREQNQDGPVDPNQFSIYENELIELIETDRLKNIFSSHAGLVHPDWARTLGAWLMDYVGKAAEIETMIFRQLNEFPDLDKWEIVRGFMTPFGASVSQALAFGQPCSSAFVQIPRLRTSTHAGKTLSLLLEMVSPTSFDTWERGSGGKELKSILASFDQEIWRMLGCRILLKAATMAGRQNAAYHIIEIYDDMN